MIFSEEFNFKRFISLKHRNMAKLATLTRLKIVYIRNIVSSNLTVPTNIVTALRALIEVRLLQLRRKSAISFLNYRKT